MLLSMHIIQLDQGHLAQNDPQASGGACGGVGGGICGGVGGGRWELCIVICWPKVAVHGT